MLLRPVSLGLRAVQFLCAVTVLGLAADMIKDQVVGSPPVTTRYSTFTGGFGMIVGGVGAVCAFVTFIPDLVPIVLDALAGLLFLGGGIAWAYGLRKTANCTNYDEMLENGLLNRGTVTVDGEKGYGVVRPDDDAEAIARRLRDNCRRAQADQILQFLCFGIAVALVALAFLQKRYAESPGRARKGTIIA